MEEPDEDAQRVGRRSQSRLRTRTAARLVTLEGNYNTVLLDLSLAGARVQAPANALRPGSHAVLNWGRFEAFGTVIWAGTSQVGIMFDHPLREATLIETRQEGFLPSEAELQRIRAREWVSGERRV